jgi:predicted nucleic acid-binding protein
VVFLLDTNAISTLMREEARIVAWLSSVRPDDSVVICTIVRGEILFGLGRRAEGRRRADLETKAQKLLTLLPCEPIPLGAGDLYASVKLTQQRRGLS